MKQAIKAASGGPDSLESLKFIVERLIGKPKQEIMSTNVQLSVKEYLESLDQSNFDSIPTTLNITTIEELEI